MVKLRFKTIGGIALLLVLCGLFYLIQFAGNVSVSRKESLVQHRMTVYDIEQVLELQFEQQDIAEKEITGNLAGTLQLYGEAAKALADKAGNGTAESLVTDETTAVLHIVDGVIRLPENAPAGLQIDREDIRGEKGAFTASADDGTVYINFYYRLSDDAYLLKWVNYEESFLFRYSRDERADIIRSIEEALGIYILEFVTPEGEDLTLLEPFYAPDVFSDYHTAKDFGFTSEMLDSAADIAQDRSFTADSVEADSPGGGHSLTVDGVQYDCYFRKMNGGTYVTVFMMPSNQPLTRAAERTALLLAVFAIIGFAFLAWALSIFKLVIRHRLNDTQKQTFQPRTVYRRAAVFLISEMLVVAGVSVFLQCLFANSYVSAVTEETLRALDTCIATEKAMTNAYQSVQMDNYEAAAETVGMLVSSKGDALNPAVLDSACEAIGADYIIIYDETGAQVMSNTAYSGLSLALGGEDMQDFSRLLKGVSPISKARVTDAQTARTHAVFAVSLARSEDGAQPGPYWAMLLFVNPDEITGEALGPAEDFLQSDSFSDSLCFSLDPDSGEILSSSKQDFVGKNAVSLGLPEDALTDHYKGFFWMVDDLVYGVSAKMNGALYYDIISQHLIYQNVPLNTLRGVAIYLCLMALLAVFLLSGYGKVFARYADRGEYLPEEENLVMTSSGRLQESVDPSRRWRFFEPVLGSRAPIRNAYQAGEAVFMLSVIVAVLYAQFGRSGVSDSAMAYILSGRWSRGFNLFAIASILFLFVVICVFTIICKFVIALATRNAGTKGETIGRLLLDFIRYVSVIVFAYYALSFVGVDTAALLASLGIITFALSLGAQDLIRDILAGLSIVMEGEYQVGDIIEVGGFRGTVLAIGVRTTKIEGRGGNILIMGNRDVKNVINRTRKNSWYALDISISETEDLSKVEALLTDQLPQIGKAIPEIISGPFYKGVVNIGRGTFGLSIIAECMEEDYYRVQRQLNGAIAVFFEEHGIQIK